MKNINRSSISTKSRGINYYIEIIGIERFASLEVFTTAGDIRPPYPYQWLAKSIPFGDDCFEGIGKSPLEAIRNLADKMKAEKL